MNAVFEISPERLARAEAACVAAGETLTPLRRRVLELLWAHPGPAKAYDLLERLRTGEVAAKPPTIYRALDFLVRLGLAHRLESLNAFVACDAGDCAHAPAVFLLCERCETAQELDAGHAMHDLDEAAHARGFAIRRVMIEVLGICAQCRQKE